MMPSHAVDSLALGTVNASLPRAVDADTLAAAVPYFTDLSEIFSKYLVMASGNGRTMSSKST